jgi:vanillate O-demethylase monooxygenase subunit
MDHPDWKLVPGNGARPIHARCNYQLVTDNLLDLSHVGYVHPDTIGDDSIVRFPIRTDRAADRVTMTRLMPDVPPPPLHRSAGGFRGNVDRWMIVEAAVPCYVDVDVGSAEVGGGALQGRRPQGIAYHALNVPTPETERTTHFFYGHARFFKIDSAEIDEVYRRDLYKIFMEDVAVMEAQQAAMDRAPDRPWVDVNGDAPGLAMRKLVRERIEAEARS